mmetsp:Transcript_27652/g.60959  ORF Transcript_27652/g.60959 Transcript_27652/m.60959 type:complete len:96 (+) Transcript_27652:261-548(+)
MYLVQNLMDMDLASYIFTQMRVPMQINSLNFIFRSIVEGLAHLHENNFFHRDLKLENIFLDYKNSICIGDFGLVRDIRKFGGLRDEIFLKTRDNT